MNFDDIKAAWDSDHSDPVETPTSVAHLKSLQTPVENLRQSMRTEVYVQVVSLLILGVFPIKYFERIFIAPFYGMYFIIVLITIYYYSKFYLFYKGLSHNTLRSKDNLYALYYETKLSIEMYRSFNYTTIPFVLMGVAMAVASNDNPKIRGVFDLIQVQQWVAIEVVAFFILLVLAAMGVTEIWIRLNYIYYLEQIKKVLDEFKENV